MKTIRVKVQTFTKGCYYVPGSDVVVPEGQELFETIGEFTTKIPDKDKTGMEHAIIFSSECSKRGWISHYRTMSSEKGFDYVAVVFTSRAQENFYYQGEKVYYA